MLQKLMISHIPLPEICLSETASIRFESVPGFESWLEMRLVRQRNHADWLFFIKDHDGFCYALRILGEHSYDYYSRCFDYQKQINNMLNIDKTGKKRSCLEYGLCGHGKYVYFMMPWQHDYTFDDIARMLPLSKKIKPAADAAAYLKAAESICLSDNSQLKTGYLLLADDLCSRKWLEQIDQRFVKAKGSLRRRSFDIAALAHFRKFYLTHSWLLADREMTVCYNRFMPRNWYYQADGSISVPLIAEWTHADKWYSLNCLLSDIHAVSEDLAILLIDFYFDFCPPEEFFICSAIYNMLNLLEQLATCSNLKSEYARILIDKVKAIDHMFVKFTSAVPNWYKKINALQPAEIIVE